MGVFSHIVGAGQSGLTTFQGTQQVIGNNIANVNTPGYVRQRALLSASNGTVGVSIRMTQGVRNRYIAEQLILGHGQLGFHHGENSALALVEATTNELNDYGLGHSMKKFQESLKKLAGDPGNVASRKSVLADADHLMYMFKHTRSEFFNAAKATHRDVKDLAGKVNDMAKLIADLNDKIRLKKGINSESEAMISERDELIQEIGLLIDVQPVANDNGTVSLFVGGGRLLVEDKFSNELVVGAQGLPPAYAFSVQISSHSGGGPLDPVKSFGGRIGGAIDTYNDTIVPSINRIDEIAFSYMNAFNTQHQAGFALDGTTGNDFFTAPAVVDGAAGNMTLDANVLDTPERIAAAAAAAELPGGNGNLTPLADVVELPGVMVDGSSAMEAWDGIVSLVAHGIQRSELGITTESASIQQLESVFSSETGVSLDEELIAMSQAKTAFDAASRVIRVADEMAMAVLGMVR